MFTNIYRAIVSFSSNETGEILVRIPAKFGPETTIPVSTIGRTAYNGSWSVPSVGAQIVVTADDDAFTNVFWVQTNPTEPVSLDEVEAGLAAAQADIEDLETSISTLETNLENNIETSINTLEEQIAELKSFTDALAFGIFR